jgi:hypothetical protein
MISEWGKSKRAEVVSFYLLKNVTRGSSWVYEQVERDSGSTTNNFTFFQKFDRLYPTSGPAEGGTNITIFGAGFWGNVSRYSIFFREENETSSMAPCKGITYVNTTMLTCTSSAWMYSASEPKVTVEFTESSGSKTVLVSDAVFKFRFVDSWSRINVSEGVASGGTAIPKSTAAEGLLVEVNPVSQLACFVVCTFTEILPVQCPAPDLQNEKKQFVFVNRMWA